MHNRDQIIKNARDCHTKESWRTLFNSIGEGVATTHTSKPVADLFKLLSSDPQCLQYDPQIWKALLSGSLSSWNLELGRTIANFTEKLPSPKIAIPAAEVHMESGSPSLARKTASRALRLSNIEPWEKLQLQMIVCNSYVEEGKHSMALRQLKRMQEAIQSAALSPQDQADLSLNMARAQFFLGRYPEAAQIFYRSYELYQQIGDWEAYFEVCLI